VNGAHDAGMQEAHKDSGAEASLEHYPMGDSSASHDPHANSRRAEFQGQPPRPAWTAALSMVRRTACSPLSPPRTPKQLWDLLSSVALSRLLPDIRPHLTTLKHNGSINSATAGSLAPRQGTSSSMCSGNSQSSSRCMRSRGMPVARISSKASCRSGRWQSLSPTPH